MKIHRQRWALSQKELSRLIGKNAHSTISRYEYRGHLPPLRTLIAYEIIFGVGLRDIVPDLYLAVEDEVGAAGAALSVELEGRSDPGAARKRQLLTEIAARVRTNDAQA